MRHAAMSRSQIFRMAISFGRRSIGLRSLRSILSHYSSSMSSFSRIFVIIDTMRLR